MSRHRSRVGEDALSEIEIERIAAALAAKVIEGLAASHEYLDAAGAAEVLGCSVPTVERRAKSGEIPSVKIGKLRRYRRSDLLSLGNAVT